MCDISTWQLYNLVCVWIVTKQWTQKTSKVKTYRIVHTTWKPVLLVRKPVIIILIIIVDWKLKYVLHFDNLFWKISQPSNHFFSPTTYFKKWSKDISSSRQIEPGHNPNFWGKMSKHQNSLKTYNKNQAQSNQNFVPLLLVTDRIQETWVSGFVSAMEKWVFKSSRTKFFFIFCQIVKKSLS